MIIGKYKVVLDYTKNNTEGTVIDSDTGECTTAIVSDAYIDIMQEKEAAANRVIDLLEIKANEPNVIAELQAVNTKLQAQIAFLETNIMLTPAKNAEYLALKGQ